MTTSRHGAIGVFDSGVGGLTVVRAVRDLLPGEEVVYLGDTARVPYGSKSARTVERYALACQQFLLDRQVGLVLVACNTASANALGALTAASPVPVIGAVEPGAEAALEATRNGHIGVIGTLATIRSKAYETAIRARHVEASVRTLACPLFVPLAEEGWTDDELSVLVARRYLSQLFEADPQIDTLVLGCTHYPLLRGAIEQVAGELARGDIRIVDSALAMARAALALSPGPSAAAAGTRGILRCFATDTSRLDELGPRFLGETGIAFELVDL